MHFHHHHHHRHSRRPRFRGYVRSRLRRRLFAWFAWSIFTTMLITGGAMWFLGPGWWRDWHRAQNYVGAELERTWDDPAARHARLSEAARTLEFDVELLDAQGHPLDAIGAACERPFFHAPVHRGDELLGEVRACRAAGYGPFKPFMVLIIGALALWGASGRIARRIARPLDELTDVVKRIGAGDYSARAKAGCNEPDEIGVVSTAVNDMAAKIEKQLKDQRELLAAVSHELRTPLARVRIISELGRDNGPTPKTWNDLDREVVEMDALVGELLASSRVDFGQVTTRDLDVKDAATRAVERAGLNGQTLKIESAAQVIKADPTLLARALANLLDNAKKHAGGAESLVVRDEPGAIVFEVHDRGPGLPDGADIFEPFKVGSDTRGEGLGLGLALVKRIADAHKGSAFAKNRDGGGAIVGVRLPLS